MATTSRREFLGNLVMAGGLFTTGPTLWKRPAPTAVAPFLTRVARPPTGARGLPTTWVARWGNVALIALHASDVSTEITRNNGVSAGTQNGWLERTLTGLRAEPAVDWRCGRSTPSVPIWSGSPSCAPPSGRGKSVRKEQRQHR